MSRDDDNASKIAEKLLQGWTMLAEYCPADGCTTPLMRGRDGRRFCVAHDMYVMSPEEAEDMKRKGGGVGGGDATATKASPTPAPAPESKPPAPDRIDFYSQLRAGRSPKSDPEPLARGYNDDGAAPMTLDRNGGAGDEVRYRSERDREIDAIHGRGEDGGGEGGARALQRFRGECRAHAVHQRVRRHDEGVRRHLSTESS